MTSFKEIGQGRERHDNDRRALDEALKAWEEAPDEEKPQKAQMVLSHVGGMGAKLADLVEDEEKAQAIRDDAKRA